MVQVIQSEAFGICLVVVLFFFPCVVTFVWMVE
jgi:hypothetical protein